MCYIMSLLTIVENLFYGTSWTAVFEYFIIENMLNYIKLVVKDIFKMKTFPILDIHKSEELI